jgi:hypothetical protein
VVIIVIGSFHFYQQKNLEREEFSNEISCPHSLLQIKETHNPVYVSNKSNQTDQTYQRFLNKDFTKFYNDEIPKYKALRETSSLYLQDKRIHILEMMVTVNAVSSFGKSLEIILKSFDNKPLIKASYDFSKKLYYLVDYTENPAEPDLKSWTATINDNTEYLGLRSTRNNTEKWLDHLWIGNKCYTVGNFDNLINQLGSVEITCDTSSVFKPIINSYLTIWDPLTPPKIYSARTKEINIIGDDIKPYATVAYRPKHSETSYYSLGDYLYSSKYEDPNLKHKLRDQEPRLMLKKGDYVKAPKNMTWMWDNKGGKDSKTPRAVYKQNDFREGEHTFHCLGDYATKISQYDRNTKTINVNESVHPHVCVRSDCLQMQNEGTYKYLYHDRKSGASANGSAWTNYYPSSTTHLDYDNKIGYPGHYLMSFKEGHSNFKTTPAEINRKANIKAECLTPVMPPELNKNSIDSIVNSKFILEKSQYDQNKNIGLETLKNEMANARTTANKISDYNQQLLENKENTYVKTVAHNTEMNNRKNEYVRSAVFLNKLKGILTMTSENQDKINEIAKDTSDSLLEYTKKLDSNKNMINDISKQLNDEGKKTVKNVEHSINLHLMDAKMPDNPAKLFT